MKIAFNPSTVAALTTPPNNKDITFDLRGRNIFARGVKFCGTDTNTWRDIKVNNVSIGSHTLDLRNGSNTTLTNTNGVVTINSTWRPVVDNLTSDSTTSSLSANQGRVLKALIDGKSDSNHNHDGRYLRLNGSDTMQGNLNLCSIGTSYIGKGLGDKSGADFTEANIVIRSWWGISFKSRDDIVRTYIDTRTGNIGTKGVLNAAGAVIQGRVYNEGDDEGIIIKPASNSYAGLILGTHNGERSVFYLTKGKPFWRYNNGSTNLDIQHPKKSGTIALTSDIPSSLKNPYSFNVFGVVYDGSAAKTVTTSNFISQVTEGPSTITDGTMLITSYASDKGFADTNAVNVPYKRKAIHLWDYIKAKTDSLYATKSHTHSWDSITDKLAAGNEFNIVNAGFNSRIWFNYLPINDRSKTATIAGYHFGNGATGYTSINASGFVKNGSSDSYVLLGGGGHQTISSLSVNYANSSRYTNYLNSVSRMDYGWNGINYFNASLTAGCAAKVNDSPTSAWWHILRFNHGNNSGCYTDLAVPFDSNSLYWKTVRHGAVAYNHWIKVLDSLNYNEYAPTKTGGGASGTWGISITGNANTVDGQHFNWNNNKNDHTYLWAATDNGNAYLVHRASISVNYANSAGSASSATKVIVNQHTTSDTNYPLVWSNQANSSTITENQLYKSWSDLYYNPKNKRLTVGGSVVASSFVKSGGTSQQLLRADGRIAAFNWSGESGQPTWLWGGNDFNSYYVYNPSNFRVAYASSAGNADTAQYLRSLGNQNCQTGRTQNYGDVYSYNTIHSNTGAPTKYTSVIGFGRGIGGTVEIAGGWCNTGLYWRSLRDCCENWYSWRTVLDSSNYTGYVDNYYWANVKISTSSSTTTSPTVHTLTATRVCAGYNPGIDNSISCSNWFRSSGDTGWYNTTYQGGWYMSDTSWIRAYNGVGIYTSGQIYSPSSIRMGNILLEHTDEINNSDNRSIHLNYRNSGNVSLCYGGGNVGIGAVATSYKLDVNGQMRASGFYHSSVNSDNYILLAGGGYKSFGGNGSNPIFLGYLNLDHGNDGTISSSFSCLGYSVPFTYTRGGSYCRISIPNTTYQIFHIKAATASVHYSGGGMDTWTGVHRGAGAWWLHCYAYGLNEIRVKGFCQDNHNNDSWWGGNPLWSGNNGANRITVCIFGYVTFR